MPVRNTIVAALAAVLLSWGLSPASPTAAQTGPQPDTMRLVYLDALLVTAERSAAAIEASTQSVFVLTADELRDRPGRNLADALRRVPGLTFVDFDGTDTDPQIMLRGFYGGGEAEYVILLVDGRPLNGLENGRIAWDLIPLTAIESIEVVRGAGSAAWGDAAMGGVINVITRGATGARRFGITAGSYGLVEGTFDIRDQLGNRPFSTFGSLSTTDGFRDHAERLTGAFGATLSLRDGPEHTLELTTLHNLRHFDEPGPLTGGDLDASRTASSPFYRFDRTEERLHRVGVDGSRLLGGGGRLTGSLAGEYRDSDRTRTVPLAPVFADTKERLLSTARGLTSLQLAYDDLALPGDDDLVVGFDAALGRISSEYYDYLTGDPSVYIDAQGGRGDLSASGSGSRTSAGAFFGYGLNAGTAIRFTLGARADWLRDSFEPDAVGVGGGESTSVSHSAFSPRAGLNVGYIESANHTGHVYLNVARSFKAPVPDQLFDQRTVPVPFPPGEITFANDELKPQYATNYEAGVYHRADLVPGQLAAELTFAAYQSDLRDELDFDLATLRYGNIGRSRHRGVESSLDLRATRGIRAYGRYTLQAATSRSGENTGNQLKAIPEHFIVGGLDVTVPAGPTLSIQMSSARGIFLDDANTVELPDWTRWDARLGYDFLGNSVFVQISNLLDTAYSTTGFPDSADPSTVYYFPAAGRTVSAGLRRGW